MKRLNLIKSIKIKIENLIMIHIQQFPFQQYYLLQQYYLHKNCYSRCKNCG